MKKIWIITVLLAGLMAGCGSNPPAASSPAPKDRLLVELLSTGKSDCALIYIDDLVIVSDAADLDDADQIRTTLRADGVNKIDYLILSHYDKDHIGSAAVLINEFEVGAVLRPAYTEDSNEYEALIAAEKKRNVPVTILNEDYTIKTANGYVTADPPDIDYGDDNNNSVITTVYYRGHRLLFMGDAKKKRTEEYLEAVDEDLDFVKLPHHGDWNKALEKLLGRSTLRWAVATVESPKDISSKLISKLDETGVVLYLTSNGKIKISWAGNDLSVEQTK